MRKIKLEELRNKLKSAIAVEILIWILVISAFCGGVWAFFDTKYIQPNLYNIELKDVDGLIKGSPVRFMGMVVGHVRKLEYTPNSIKVQIIITKKDLKVPQGSIAAVEFTGLAGSKSIELYPPESDLSDMGIVTKESMRLSQMFDALEYTNKTFQALKNFTDNLTQKNILNVFGAVAKTSKVVNGAQKKLQETDEQKEKFDKKVQEVIEKQDKIDKTLDKLNGNAMQINSYFKK